MNLYPLLGRCRVRGVRPRGLKQISCSSSGGSARMRQPSARRATACATSSQANASSSAPTTPPFMTPSLLMGPPHLAPLHPISQKGCGPQNGHKRGGPEIEIENQMGPNPTAGAPTFAEGAPISEVRAPTSAAGAPGPSGGAPTAALQDPLVSGVGGTGVEGAEGPSSGWLKKVGSSRARRLCVLLQPIHMLLTHEDDAGGPSPSLICT